MTQSTPLPAGPQPASVPASGGSTFQAVRSRRTFEIVCDEIRNQIKVGNLRPGGKLPNERELARQFSVSRAVLREALRSLEIAGLISLKKGPRGGAFIREGNSQTITQSIRDLAALGTISVEQLSEARVMLQEVIIRLACRRATQKDFDALLANVEATEKLANPSQMPERIAMTLEFYKILANATGNNVFVILIDALIIITREFLLLAGPEITPDVIKSRRRVIAHLKERSPEKAIKEMTRHLTALHAKWREKLPSGEPPRRRSGTRRTAGPAS